MTARLSNSPYTADVLFKHGAKRTIHYAASCVSGGFFQFYTNKDGAGPVVFINADTVESVEFEEALQPAGVA